MEATRVEEQPQPQPQQQQVHGTWDGDKVVTDVVSNILPPPTEVAELVGTTVEEPPSVEDDKGASSVPVGECSIQSLTTMAPVIVILSHNQIYSICST
jgi:hypothetical protein